MSETALQQCLEKMREAGISQAAIDNFAHYWRLCASGETGLIREDTIRALLDPPQLDQVQVSEADARAALQQTVIIKLNGGLGTSMGLDQSKTLLTVREGRNFLDLIVEQVRYARAHFAARLPLLFMNSFRTRDDTLAHLAIGWGICQLKAGAFARAERMAKWNEVLRIEEAAGPHARFAGRSW